MAANAGARRVNVSKVDTRIVLTVLACLAASVATYLLYTAPSQDAARAAQAQVDTARAELGRKQTRIAEITSGRKSGAAELLSTARALDRQMPDDVDKVALVAAIPGLASDAGVTVNQMDPVAVPEDKKAGATKVQAFTVAATGAVPALTAWLADLQTYPAVMTVSNLQVTVASGGGQSTATFTLRAHWVTAAALAQRD